MPLNRSKGNMYDWVTHTWSPIIGCPHQCEYCYVKTFRDQPIKPELRDDFPPLGRHRTIFVGHLCDTFAESVPEEMIERILAHCGRWPENTYVFQTKNPRRLRDFGLPLYSIVGTTIETNRDELLAQISKAPPPAERAYYISRVPRERFITIEPILEFDTNPLLSMIHTAQPTFVNIGADSKAHALPEPTRAKVQELIDELTLRGILIRKKMNLDRLMSPSGE